MQGDIYMIIQPQIQYQYSVSRLYIPCKQNNTVNVPSIVDDFSLTKIEVMILK